MRLLCLIKCKHLQWGGTEELTGLPATSMPLKLGKGRSTMKELLGSSKEVPFMSLIPLQGGKHILFIIANNNLAIPISTCPHTWYQVLTQLHSRPFWHKEDFNFASPLADVSSAAKCYCHTWLVYAEVMIAHVIFAGRCWQPQHMTL